MKPILLLATLTILAGCDSARGPKTQRVPGELAVESSVQTITVPEPVQAGRAVPVTVLTQGGGCESQGDTEVAFVDGAVEIRPYDRTAVLRGNEACAFLLQRFPHTVLVTFPAAGPVIVRAIGQTAYSNQTQTRELSIVVR